MKINEMRELTIDELNENLTALIKKLFELRMGKALLKLDDTSQIPKTNYQIAQIKTVIREKQLQQAQV